MEIAIHKRADGLRGRSCHQHNSIGARLDNQEVTAIEGQSLSKDAELYGRACT